MGRAGWEGGGRSVRGGGDAGWRWLEGGVGVHEKVGGGVKGGGEGGGVYQGRMTAPVG